MRPKFLLGLAGIIILILAGVLVINRSSGPHPSAPPENAPDAAPPATAAAAHPPQAVAAAASAATNAAPVSAEAREAAIQAEIERLNDWAMNDDPASLASIMADLSSPEKEIRLAAIEAAKQFGSPDAIPGLKEAAARSSDTEEQIELLQAAEFLSLPSITSLGNAGSATPPTDAQAQAREQNKAQAEARRQQMLQNRGRGLGGRQPATPGN